MSKYYFNYEGVISEDLNVSIGQALKASLETNIPMANRIQRMITFALEMLDNALRYSTDKTVNFEWHAKEDQLMIRIKNFSNVKDAEKLQQTVRHVNSLSREEVYEEYLKVMKNEEFNEKGGAGLGILHLSKLGAQRIAVQLEGSNDLVKCTCEIVAPIELKLIEKKYA
jgi:hypothetical protein